MKKRFLIEKVASWNNNRKMLIAKAPSGEYYDEYTMEIKYAHLFSEEELEEYLKNATNSGGFLFKINTIYCNDF